MLADPASANNNAAVYTREMRREQTQVFTPEREENLHEDGEQIEAGILSFAISIALNTFSTVLLRKSCS
jgi:hypothetical protein